MGILGEVEGPVIIDNVRLYLHPKVYKPAEDTFILLEFIPKVVKGKKVVDLGCGVGVLGIKALLEGAREAILVDLNPYAVRISRINVELNGLNGGAHIIQSDLLSPLRTLKKVDLIIFNPPYLPGRDWDDWLDYSWYGGEGGVEVFSRFICQLTSNNYVGELVFTSPKTREWEEAVEKLVEADYDIEKVGGFHKFFETVEVYYCVRRL